MPFILASALCSVLVSILLKLARRRGFDIPQAVAWNYVATSALTAWVFHPSLAPLANAGWAWLPMIGLGILLPTIFMVLGWSVRQAGIVRTDTAQRLSLLLSLLAAFLLFGETPGLLRLVGLALGLLALACLLWRSPHAEASDWRAPLLVFAGFGVIDIFLKLVAQAGVPFATSLQVAFGLSFLVAMLIVAVRRRFAWRNLGVGLLLGVVNFGNIVFYVMAHQALAAHPAVVFAAMNLGVIVLGTLVGRFGFGERLRLVNVVGLGLAVAAIAVLSTVTKA